MNKKLFKKVFLWSLSVYLILFALVSCSVFWNRNLGGGTDIAEIDEASANEQRNLIIFGTDKSGLRSDVIMVLSVDPTKDTVSLLSIPRDTKVQINRGNQKINAALQIGQESLAVQTVKDLTGLSIHDYLTVNFSAVETVIDELGGVQFDVPCDMDYEDPDQDLFIHIRKGDQLLDGAESVKVLRFRQYPMGDLQRNQVQQDFFHAVFEQKFRAKYIAKIPSIYSLIEENIESSMSVSELLSYVNAISKMEEPVIQTFELPVSIADPYVVMNEWEADQILTEYFGKEVE
ncbi:MAG: LCP family protein [Clostridia bacterium]|nr:LCP family protein [Clostridia bacterium]